MKRFVFALAAVCSFAVAPEISRLGPVTSSAVLVWTAVLLAVSASGGINALAIAAGALGALGSGVLRGVSPVLSTAFLIGFALAERTSRVVSRRAAFFHIALAITTGGLAGGLSNAFGASPLLAVRLVSAVVCGALVSIPLFVSADDPIAHVLELASECLNAPSRDNLRHAAVLRRTENDVRVDAALRERLSNTWKALVRLSDARVRLERNEASFSLHSGKSASSKPEAIVMLDDRIAERVAVIKQALEAVTTVQAAALGLEDADFTSLGELGESLEDETRALVEVKESGTSRS